MRQLMGSERVRDTWPVTVEREVGFIPRDLASALRALRDGDCRRATIALRSASWGLGFVAGTSSLLAETPQWRARFSDRLARLQRAWWRVARRVDSKCLYGR